MSDDDDHDTPPSSSSSSSSEALLPVSSGEDKDLSLKNQVSPSISGNNIIKAVNSDVTHRICSGQVIVSLSTAVKELVENSLDAGAKSVEIRLVEFGSKLIEVRDNGIGVEESNFEGLALKHHTSKLSVFEDLESIATFGFRGEALSSLCALSTLTIITRNKESNKGMKIEYDSSGRISSKSPIGREIGTTVSLANIFAPIPVRHKELLKNIRREYNKMVNVLYGYSFIALGVRISCTNETKGSNSTKVFCVPANESTKERIATIFGSKQLASLIDIEETYDIPEDILSEYGLTKSTFQATQFKLTGVISGPNAGRGCGDRQFYYINSRPCELPKISRIVNEVYHTFSRNQYPFIFLNITTEQENVDVNVTPDKRNIYMLNEKILYAKIKGTLIENLMKASSNFTPNSTFQTTLSFSPTSAFLENSLYENEDDDSNDGKDDVEMLSNTEVFASSIIESPSLQSPENSSPRNTMRAFLTKFKFGNQASGARTPEKVSNTSSTKRPTSNTKKEKIKQPKLMDFVYSKTKWSLSPARNKDDITVKKEEEEDVQIVENASCESEPVHPASAPASLSVEWNIEEVNSQELEVVVSQDSTITIESVRTTESSDSEIPVVFTDYGEDEAMNGGTVPVESSLGVDWELILCNFNESKEDLTKIKKERTGRRFRAKISPDDNTSAEDELKKELTKEMFKQMHLIGQFNLGFIITRVGSDLFIIDQHAADEKYNYENLEKTTVLQGQRLIIPMPLQLPATSENILIDNLEVFERNGFNFDIDEDDEPTNRISLTKIPYSKSCQFGKQDVEELIFLLEDAPEKSFYRPIKVKSMLASRACRKSVMIGDKLNLKDMVRVVCQLSEIDQPWNCPHGRPTLRHLFNLDLVSDPESSNLDT